MVPDVSVGGGNQTLTPVELGLTIGIVSIVTVVTVIFSILFVRRQQSRVIVPPPVSPTQQVDTVIQDSAIQSLSARVASIEGRIGTIAATMEGMAILQQRVAAMETNMPAIQEAYERYGDQISRADKRMTERQRRSDKDQGISAGEAAAALSGAAGVDGGNPTPTQPVVPTNSKDDRPWILGRNRR